MNLQEKNGVKFFVFDNIEKTGLVNHCFSTKIGGVSCNEFESLNLGYNRGDSKENVDENYKILLNACEISNKKLIFGKQIHDKKIFIANSNFNGQLTEFDGYITNDNKTCLITFHADCVPLFFVDTKNKAIGVSHAGWKGTAKNIAGETVKEMVKAFNTNPKDIVAGIGPSIGVCCFQVGAEVKEEFENNFSFANEYIIEDVSENGKFKIDLWGINKELMKASGVLEENIEITNECTMCNSKLFYSHRRMGEKRGSMAAFMSLK